MKIRFSGFRKICTIVLVCMLILGIISTSFGVTVAAFGSNNTALARPENTDDEDLGPGVELNKPYQAPTEQYTDINNEANLKSNVKVLTELDSSAINTAISTIESGTTYNNTAYFDLTIEGNEHSTLNHLRTNDIFYLHGDATTPFGDDRIFKVSSISSYSGRTYLRVTEPYFEEVFDNLEICSSDPLNQSTYVGGSFAEGVSVKFNTQNDNILGLANNGTSSAPASSEIAPHKLANDNASQLGTIEITIDYNFANDAEGVDENNGVELSYGIKGTFGIRDLTSHLVCDMPSPATFEELYVGLSGETFAHIDLYGKLEASSELEGKKKDLFLVEISGLNEKRFPIAVLQFKGTTPVAITHSMFESSRESLIPSLYVIVYSNWEGEISLELNGGFNYSNSFNNGLRIFKDGEPCLQFENYPYQKAYDVESGENLSWDINLTLEANIDVTILGGSVVFYVAGINICEISIARIGFEAQCDLTAEASSTEGFKILSSDDTNFYIRCYLKMLEIKVKLKAEGKSFLKGLSIDVDFEFGLLDLTLFCEGLRPNKFRPKVPVSSMQVPSEFESVISLVCDVSGSMADGTSSGKTKMQMAIDAAKVIVNSTNNWANTYKNGNYGIGIISFTQSAQTVAVPHIDYKFLNECIDTLNASGGTAVATGIEAGVFQLDAVKSTNKVMLLMTDGQDYNDSATRKAAQEAKDKGIIIYTVGFGNDVNEDILKEVASITGGEYKFADTSNHIGIIKGFMYAQQSSVADIVTEFEGEVGDGKTSKVSYFEIENSDGDLNVSNVWTSIDTKVNGGNIKVVSSTYDASVKKLGTVFLKDATTTAKSTFLDTILTDPHGRVVDENYPGAVIDKTTVPTRITVSNPIKGKWSVRIKGVEVANDTEPFYTIVSFKELDGSGDINGKMDGVLEPIAAYAIPVGIILTVTSILLLICMPKRSKNENQ